MKKFIAILMFLVFAQATVFAAAPGTPEYEKIKAYKTAQREKKAQEKAAEKVNPSVKKDTFWSREASRSGFAGTGAMFSNAIFNTIPLAKPGSGKQTK